MDTEDKKHIRIYQNNTQLKEQLQLQAVDYEQKELQLLQKYNHLQQDNDNCQRALEVSQQAEQQLQQEIQAQNQKHRLLDKIIKSLENKLNQANQQI